MDSAESDFGKGLLCTKNEKMFVLYFLGFLIRPNIAKVSAILKNILLNSGIIEQGL